MILEEGLAEVSGGGSKEECKARRNLQNLGQDYNHCLLSMDPAPELLETPSIYHLISSAFSSQHASMGVCYCPHFAEEEPEVGEITPLC